MIDTIILYLYYGLFFLTPLVMSSATSELFEFNKMLLIYIITALIGGLWLIKMILSKKIVFKKTSLDLPIGLFFISQILATIFSIDVHTSIFGYYGRFNGGLLSIFSYLILYYAFVSNLDRSAVKKILTTSLISSILVILWGIPGKLGYDLSCLVFMGQFNNKCWTSQFDPAARMFSTLGQPNWLGAFLAINFFIALYFFIKSLNNEKKLNSYLLGGYLVLSFVITLFTRSRSAFLSVIAGIGFFGIYYFLKNKKDKAKLRTVGILITLIILSVIIFKTGIDKVDRILSGQFQPPRLNVGRLVAPAKNTQTKPATEAAFRTDVTESLDIRKIVWEGAINLGFKYPFFGSGVETYAYSYYFVRPASHNLTSEWDYLYNKAHNEFLNYLATTGFVGFFTYLFMIGMVIFALWQRISNSKFKIKNSLKIENLKLKIKDTENQEKIPLAFYLLLAYFTILVTNFFGFSTSTINLFFYLIPAFIVVQEIKRDDYETKLKGLNIFQQGGLLLVSGLVVYSLFSIGRYWLADTNYAMGDSFARVDDYKSSANYLNQALQLKYEPVYQDRLSQSLASLAVIASLQRETDSTGAADTTSKLMSAADYYNQQALKASPKNLLYWKTRAKNYYLFYQITLNPEEINEGVSALKQAETLTKTDPKLPYSLSIFYSLLADDTEDKTKKTEYENLSLAEIEKAIKLKSNFRDGYYLKGQLLKKYGRTEEAKKVFQFILKKIDSTDQEVKKELTN